MVDPFIVKCSSCKAIPGTQCINSVTGKPLRKALAHPLRIRDAEKAQEADAA